jgi:Methyltransferase domain
MRLLPSQPRNRLRRALRRPARSLGMDVVERTFYSPIPDVDSLPDSLWAGPRPHPGIDLRTDEQLRYLEEDLAPYVPEFTPPRTGTPDGSFYLDNGAYESVDAEVLYATLRHFKPPRVLEVGSGFSTLVSAQAVRANASDGTDTHLVACDPFPRDFLTRPVEGLAEMRPLLATDIPVEEFASLEGGDVLFIDTTHTVKIGGDVNYLFLEALPALAPGVIVHVHDIFLPWEYPRRWVEELELYWAEQYLLQAFLAYNPRFEVLLGNHHLSRSEPERLGRVIPSFGPGVAPGGFWLRVTA